DDQHRLQAPQHPVRPPILRQFHGGALQMAAVLLQFALEFLEQGDRIRHRPGEAGHHAAAVKAPHLLGAVLHHQLVAEGHLAVAGDGALAIVADGADGGAVKRPVHARTPPACAASSAANLSVRSRARLAIASFLSFLLRIRRSGGGMRPKLMFIGWKLPGSAEVTYLARLPMAVSSGQTAGASPRASRAAFTP